MSTDSPQIRAARTAIAEALTPVAAPEFSDSLADFSAGKSDIAIDKLSLDSVARVELLVALELECNVVMPPEALAEHTTLGKLAAAVVANGTSIAPAKPVNHLPAQHKMDDRAPPVVNLIQRALRNRRAVGHVRRICLSLEHRLAPPELCQLIEWQARHGVLPISASAPQRETFSDWLDQMHDDVVEADSFEPQPFQTKRINTSTVLYRGPGNQQSKSLLIGFTGRGRRLMISHPAFLQRIDATRFDVLIVADPLHSSFRGAVPQLGHGAIQIVESIKNIGIHSNYKLRRVFGCSAGAYPALVAGGALAADACVSIAGRFPSERHADQILRMFFNVRSAYRGERSCPVLFTFAADKARDRAYARWMMRASGGRALGVRIRHCDIGHMLLEPLLHRGLLKTFFEQTLLTPAKPARLDNASRWAELNFN